MYISGETFNSLCPISIYSRQYLSKFPNILKYTTHVLFIDEMTSSMDMVIKDNKNIFFIKVGWLNYFIENIMPKLTQRFILITHNGDELSGCSPEILKHPLLIKWYGQNMSVISEKTEGIPIGLENSSFKRTDFNVINQNKNNSKVNLLYVNFSIMSNKNRANILKIILNNDFLENKKKPWNNYIEELSTYKFSVSPPGNGVDCHRTWECLYLGVIPIVENSPVMSFFSDLPILFIDNYNMITKDYLTKKYLEIKNKEFNLEKLHLDYYRSKIEQEYLKNSL